jgi:hypothetical protein
VGKRLINIDMLDKDRLDELLFLVETRYPVLVINGSQGELKAIENAKKHNNPMYNINNHLAKLPKYSTPELLYEDIYTILDLIYAEVFSIVYIDVELCYVAVRSAYDFRLFNGTEIVDIEFGQQLKCQVDHYILNQVAEYFYSEQESNI